MKNRILLGLVFTAVLSMTIGICMRIYAPNPDNYLTLYGNVDVRLIDIAFRVSGKVDQLYFEEGDTIKQNALLCTLEKNPYDSQVEEAMANIESIQANLNNAERLLQRRLELVGVGGVSQEDVDNSQSSRDQLLASLAQAEATLAVRLDELSYTEVYAPTDGIILSRIREPGSVVNSGEPVYTLSVASPVWIRAFVDEPDLGSVVFGMEAEITNDLKNGKVYKGKVGFISPVAEFTPKIVQSEQLRTDLVYRLRIYVDNPDDELKQGMPVTVKLKK